MEARAGIAEAGERESLTDVDEADLLTAISCGPTRDIAPFETESEILYPVPYGQAEGVDPQARYFFSSLLRAPSRLTRFQVSGNHLLFYTDSYGVDPEEIRPAIKPGESVTRVYRQPDESKTIVYVLPINVLLPSFLGAKLSFRSWPRPCGSLILPGT